MRGGKGPILKSDSTGDLHFGHNAYQFENLCIISVINALTLLYTPQMILSQTLDPNLWIYQQFNNSQSLVEILPAEILSRTFQISHIIFDSFSEKKNTSFYNSHGFQ